MTIWNEKTQDDIANGEVGMSQRQSDVIQMSILFAMKRSEELGNIERRGDR